MPEVLKTVGRYEILREVGRGGMAMVYLARQTDLDRFVALKELAAFHASDGCMAFELFTGKVPFHDSEAPMAILLRHVNEAIPAVNSIDPEIDQGLSDWVERLLVKDPKERTQSANEAWDDLEEIVIGLLGPRWRRGARLSAPSGQVTTPKPLTPAPFEGTGAAESVSDEFQSFAWGEPVTDTPPGASEAVIGPERSDDERAARGWQAAGRGRSEGAAAPPGPATPPPANAPPGPLEPGPVDVPTGPPTPPPLTPWASPASSRSARPARLTLRRRSSRPPRRPRMSRLRPASAPLPRHHPPLRAAAS